MLDHNNGDVIINLPQYSVFGEYQILLNSRSNVCFNTCPDEKVVCFTVPKDIFIKMLSRFKGHTEFYTERALAQRRAYKRMISKLHEEMIKYCRQYSADEINPEIIESGINPQLDDTIGKIKNRRSKASLKKVNAHSVDINYQVYFDKKYKKEFGIEHYINDELEEEIDYLSENETEHRSDDSSTFTLIRQANKVKNNFKQVNYIIEESLAKVNSENFRRLQSMLTHSNLSKNANKSLDEWVESPGTQANIYALADDSHDNNKMMKFKKLGDLFRILDEKDSGLSKSMLVIIDRIKSTDWNFSQKDLQTNHIVENNLPRGDNK